MGYKHQLHKNKNTLNKLRVFKMSSDDKLVAKPLYSYGQFKVCECSSVTTENKPKNEGIKINIKGPIKPKIGGKFNIDPNK